MEIDKNLFLYDFAVVAIMKNEEPYVKEWLDYHLLAGVDHFFIYDNDSTEDFKKILQPYVDAGIVTYIFYPGKARQFEAYNAAVRDYKCYCRYMAFIDGDEFIFPKSKNTITEIVDEVLSDNPNAASFGANWVMYGSNHQDKADYNHGVIERFTLREENVNKHIKTIANPRKINYFWNSHFAIYFAKNFSVNEQGEKFEGAFNEPPTAEKIVINHYYMKSREEYLKKVQRGVADGKVNTYDEKIFSHEKENDIFDDGILKYRDERQKLLVPNGDIVNTFADINQLNFNKLVAALSSNLLAGFDEEDTTKFFDNPKNRFDYFKMLTKFFETAPKEFFKNKVETFLTCLSLSSFLKETFIDKELGSLFEEFSLYAICQSFYADCFMADLQLLIKELPKILTMPYPIVGEVREICLEMIPQFMDMHRVYNQMAWKEFVELDYILEMLKVFDHYEFRK